VGCTCCERVDQRGAAAGVEGAHPPQVAVEASGLHQGRQRELVQQRRPAVAEVLLGGDGLGVGGRAEDPAKAQRRRQGLADRAKRHDPVGREALQRPDRLAVVAELCVVVVFDDDAVAFRRPREQFVAPLGCQDDPAGPLVGGGEQDRADPGRTERAHVDAVVVDRDRDRLDSRPLGCGHRGAVAVPRVLEGHPVHTPAEQHPQHEVESLREAGAGDDVLGVGRGRPDATQVAGQHLAEVLASARVGVVEGGGGRVTGQLTLRPQPVGPREARQVGHAGGEVGDEPGRGRRRRGGDRRRDGCGQGCHAGRGADPGGQVALGVELAVAVLHQAAGDAQRTGHLAGGRESFSRLQPPAADRLAQPAFELGPQRLGLLAVQRQQHLRAQTGPLDRHGIGS
jgi:hypothetical protein